MDPKYREEARKPRGKGKEAGSRKRKRMRMEKGDGMGRRMGTGKIQREGEGCQEV